MGSKTDTVGYAFIFFVFYKHYLYEVPTKECGSSIASVVAGSKPTRSWDKPQFDDIAPRNITAIVGQTAELNCYVKHPGDRVVSNIFMLHLPRIRCFSPVLSDKSSRVFSSVMYYSNSSQFFQQHSVFFFF
ncbi:hypothetical protein ALC60_01577 [Trachymyrmex zeteki]|uniref:Ig-like domain-containing protein n=1 Tax=Mycetomoellerius zeteki TaxID=64791 RepID=A0A151XGG0_9HYME|nr:hypothetical protein ALC60_01577 [Trachymyrmex zeteki]